jgi:AraC-like DNA-binding protein
MRSPAAAARIEQTRQNMRALGATDSLFGDGAGRRFQVAVAAPAPALAPFVGSYWIVTWDLRGQPPHRQDVLPRATVNVTFKAGRTRVAGVTRGLFTEQLDGAGTVLGVQFRAGGFRPFLGAPTAAITGRFLDLADVFGVPAGPVEGTVLADPEPAAMAAVADRFLARHIPRGPAAAAAARAVEEAGRLVAEVSADPNLRRVDTLARHAGVSVRGLQRMCQEYVGMGPKALLRRYRLREAARRIATGPVPSWAGLAADLGYADQSHLVRDFTALLGAPPARLARRLSTATTPTGAP